MDDAFRKQLIEWDRAHVWHPFTPMRQWRETEPLIIEAAEGDYLIDARGRRYLDGVSSLWCNVHGHHVPAIDGAIRDQLDKVAHTTMLGMANVPATRLAARLAGLAPGRLNKVFYSDAGATATEVAFKMAIGHAFHGGHPERHVLLALSGAYHGDTTGSMSVGYSPTFHKPFEKMVFRTEWFDAPDTAHDAAPWDRGDAANRVWSLEDASHAQRVSDAALAALDRKLDEGDGSIAAIVIEPRVQGAAGMIVQPEGFLSAVAECAAAHGVPLIADEVATGFGRTGAMFACELEGVEPSLMCLGKGITGGYLPLAATLATDAIAESFEGELHEHRTLYHGHTYTGNPLACAAALASLDLFERNNLLHEVRRKAERLAQWLEPLRDAKAFPHVFDVRQVGLMVGIELSTDQAGGTGFDPSRTLGRAACAAARKQGAILRPLGNVVVLMPPLAITDEHLEQLVDILLQSIESAAE